MQRGADILYETNKEAKTFELEFPEFRKTQRKTFPGLKSKFPNKLALSQKGKPPDLTNDTMCRLWQLIHLFSCPFPLPPRTIVANKSFYDPHRRRKCYKYISYRQPLAYNGHRDCSRVCCGCHEANASWKSCCLTHPAASVPCVA